MRMYVRVFFLSLKDSMESTTLFRYEFNLWAIFTECTGENRKVHRSSEEIGPRSFSRKMVRFFLRELVTKN